MVQEHEAPERPWGQTGGAAEAPPFGEAAAKAAAAAVAAAVRPGGKAKEQDGGGEKAERERLEKEAKLRAWQKAEAQRLLLEREKMLRPTPERWDEEAGSDGEADAMQHQARDMEQESPEQTTPLTPDAGLSLDASSALVPVVPSKPASAATDAHLSPPEAGGGSVVADEQPNDAVAISTHPLIVDASTEPQPAPSSADAQPTPHITQPYLPPSVKRTPVPLVPIAGMKAPPTPPPPAIAPVVSTLQPPQPPQAAEPSPPHSLRTSDGGASAAFLQQHQQQQEQQLAALQQGLLAEHSAVQSLLGLEALSQPAVAAMQQQLAALMQTQQPTLMLQVNGRCCLLFWGGGGGVPIC